MAAMAVILAFSSCSVTRRVPEGQRLLVRNVVEPDKQAPKKERIDHERLSPLVALQANRRLLGTNLYVHIHNMASPDTTKRGWLNRTFRRMGEKPVLLDTARVRQSAQAMRGYAQYRGFYDAHIDYSIDTSRRKKAAVTYTMHQNEPYRKVTDKA